MPSLVVDTHAAIWYLLQSSKLSASAFSALDEASQAGDSIYLAAISLVEVIYLAEKGKISQAAVERLLSGVADPTSSWVLAPLDFGVAQAVGRVSRDAIPDMPDRIIAATALHLNLPLVTRDAKIRASGLPTIW